MATTTVIEKVPLGDLASRPCLQAHRDQVDDSDLVPYAAFRHLTDDAAATAVIPLSPDEVASLVDRITVAVLTGRVRAPDWTEGTLAAVRAQLAQPPQQYLVKVADASHKDRVGGVRPVATLDDLWAQLLDSARVLAFATACATRGRGSALVLRPWDPRIQPTNEYRAFVRQGRLVAVSQQHPRLLALHPPPAVALDAIVRWVEAHQIATVPLPAPPTDLAWPWPDAAVDLWVEDREGQDHRPEAQAHLIEVNPGTPHSGAGSALFSWEELGTDHPTLRLRVLCADDDPDVVPASPCRPHHHHRRRRRPAESDPLEDQANT